ncbi:hypothetical protein Glove_276g75 [Diversispora epigaea]|uniref:Uncharacterized protein n=1 Tax=Diversispora epigaea TaxID=1348612 RepID=A0A397I368_9GLOM|nr:hypothetical protein Glove_276g75 [Diversispora epigaea]
MPIKNQQRVRKGQHFGLSKLIKKNVENPQKRNVFGVLLYPEVLSGEEYTKAVDVIEELEKYYFGYEENTCKNNNKITIKIKEQQQLQLRSTTKRIHKKFILVELIFKSSKT